VQMDERSIRGHAPLLLELRFVGDSPWSAPTSSLFSTRRTHPVENYNRVIRR